LRSLLQAFQPQPFCSYDVSHKPQRAWGLCLGCA
jgi:hypothetical protein